MVALLTEGHTRGGTAAGVGERGPETLHKEDFRLSVAEQLAGMFFAPNRHFFRNYRTQSNKSSKYINFAMEVALKMLGKEIREM